MPKENPAVESAVTRAHYSEWDKTGDLRYNFHLLLNTVTLYTLSKGSLPLTNRSYITLYWNNFVRVLIDILDCTVFLEISVSTNILSVHVHTICVYEVSLMATPKTYDISLSHMFVLYYSIVYCKRLWMIQLAVSVFYIQIY